MRIDRGFEPAGEDGVGFDRDDPAAFAHEKFRHLAVARSDLDPGLVGLEMEVFDDALSPAAIAQEVLAHFLA